MFLTKNIFIWLYFSVSASKSMKNFTSFNPVMLEKSLHEFWASYVTAGVFALKKLKSPALPFLELLFCFFEVL